MVKRFYKPEWGDSWREHFSVDIINGTPGNELKCDNRKLVANYLRVGFDEGRLMARRSGCARISIPPPKSRWRTTSPPRSSFPPGRSSISTRVSNPSVKFVHNTESRLFQRPDEAIHRGYDKQTEQDLSEPGNFLSNFQPLPRGRRGNWSRTPSASRLTASRCGILLLMR